MELRIDERGYVVSHVRIDSNGFAVYTCPLCGGSSHPATGCAYSSTFVVCVRCTRAACSWIQSWTVSKGKRKGLSFYEYAGTARLKEK